MLTVALLLASMLPPGIAAVTPDLMRSSVQPQRIGAGDNHTLALKSDGTTWTTW